MLLLLLLLFQFYLVPQSFPFLTRELYLVFDGIKMGARVRVNGHVVGVANNQFRRFQFPIASYLHAKGSKKPNRVSVEFPAQSRGIDCEVCDCDELSIIFFILFLYCFFFFSICVRLSHVPGPVHGVLRRVGLGAVQRHGDCDRAPGRAIRHALEGDLEEWYVGLRF
jgi:hypothetical protein